MNPRQLTKRQSHLRSISSFHSEHDACPISDAALSALEFHEKLPTIIPVTPLPMKTVIVLSLVVFSEPMSMTVLFPFVYFMVRDFGIVDKDIGFYAGYIASSFSIAQFLTSILWGTMSDKFGRRPILLIGLFGNTITCLAFGVSKSLLWAVTSRFCCGLLNGNIGIKYII